VGGRAVDKAVDKVDGRASQVDKVVGNLGEPQLKGLANWMQSILNPNPNPNPVKHEWV
jgi:hypothetical protein